MIYYWKIYLSQIDSFILPKQLNYSALRQN